MVESIFKLVMSPIKKKKIVSGGQPSMAASAHMALTRPMELRSAGLRAASSKELALTSTTHGLTSGKELVSSSEESRKSEFALWKCAMENMETSLSGFAEKIACCGETFRKTVSKSMHLEDKDRRALAAEFTANMAQLYHKAASEYQQRGELFAPTVTAPLVSLPKTSAQVPSVYKYKPKTSAMLPSACAESPPECALVTNGKEAMRPSNTVPAPATGAVVQQVVIGVSVKTDKPVDVKLEPGTSEPSMARTSIFVGGISRSVTNVQLRGKFGPETKIIRRYYNEDKMGFASIRIPSEDMDRVLKLDLSVAGHKLRVAKWVSSRSPVRRAPIVATTNRRNGDQAMKEQARFLMEFLDAQAARPGDRRLYSQAVVSNTSEVRMKSMETTMKQILKRLSERSVS